MASETTTAETRGNLIDNAIKFTQEGTVYVTVEIDKKYSTIIVRVKDTGTGIDPDILPRLFTKFVTKSDRSTGLGLYISKGIIEAHGGRIWAENNSEGKGTGDGVAFPFRSFLGDR